MEALSPLRPISPFLAPPINLRSSVPGRVSFDRLRTIHDINTTKKPWKWERRSKEWWRWEEFPGTDDLISDKDPDSILLENPNPNPSLEVDEEDDLAEELEEMEEEAMDGRDEGREPSDYDRRAQIFDESSRVFRALKEKNDNNTNGGNDRTS